jgi:hypothetical protein
VSQQIIVACASYDEESIINYSAFAPEIIEQPKYSPFFFTYAETYPNDQNYNPANSDDYNLNEWYKYFDQKINKKDLAWFIYSSTPLQLETIYQSLKLNAKLPDTLQQKTLIHLKKSTDMLDVFSYLKLVKNAEPVFTPMNYDWYEPVINDSANAVPFQKEFLDGFQKSKTLFLKHRYGFQLIRAYFYSNEFNKAAQVMSAMPALTPKQGSIYYRALGYKAAALYRLKKYKESNLIYAQLYDEYEPQQLSAYRSFHMLEDSAWVHNVAMAKTLRQKENMWQLYGIYANPLMAIHHIYELNPKSDLLPLLVVRNVNIIETEDLQYPTTVYANEEQWQYYNYKRDPYIDSNLIVQNWNFDYSNKLKVLQVLHRIIEERKVPTITPYLVSAAYLHALSKQYSEAIQLSNEALKLSTNAIVINQAEIIKAFVLVMQANNIDEAKEQEIVNQLNLINSNRPAASRAPNAVDYVMYILGKKYQEQGKALKSELCYASSLYFYQQSEQADEMIDFMERHKHSAFEAYLLQRYHLKLDQVRNIKGIRLLYEYNFKEAINQFEKLNYDDKLWADPFTMRAVDCHDCDFYDTLKDTYTRKTFAQRMLQLQQSIDHEKNKETAAQNAMLYANALYNMTYFGNGRFIAETPIAWLEDNYTSDFDQRKKRSDSYYNCSEALSYYLKAQSLTNNKELAAQAAWGAAKCEHNLKLMQYIPWQNQIAVDFEAGTYFLEMKSKYAGTKYYKEVLNECGYFCTYITKDTTCIRDKWSLRNR